MASGDSVLVGLYPIPPGADGCATVFRLGGSTPGELLETYSFDADSVEYMDFIGRVSDRYAGAALSVRLPWVAASATTGSCTWDVAIRRLNTAEDIDVAHTYAYQSATTTAPATNGFQVTTSIAMTQAQADAIVAGEPAILRVRRGAASDTMVGDAQLIGAAIAVIEA